MNRSLVLALPVLLLTGHATAQPAPSGRDVLIAFKALHSALDIGVNYDDYSRRLIDTKIRFDRYYEQKNATVNDTKTKAAISAAMNYHRLAQSAWSTKIKTGEVRLFNFDSHKDDTCRHLKTLMDDITRNYAHVDDRSTMVVDPWNERLIPALWSCASDKITEAEKLLGGAK